MPPHSAGGMYSSTNDITSIGQSILRSTLLSAADTRKWMKPRAHTADLTMSVGAPWEIIRLAVPLSRSTNATRVVDLYTKQGDAGAYSSLLVLDPDHNAGISVLAAGSATTATVEALGGLLTESFVPALEEAAREHAAAVYAGTYVAHGAKSRSSNLTLTVDDARPGLGVSEWFSNGVDMQATVKTLLGATGEDVSVSIRLYPMQLAAGDKMAFRAVFELLPKPASPGRSWATCQSWTSVDSLVYGSIGLDEFEFEMDGQKGKAGAVSPRALRERLVRN